MDDEFNDLYVDDLCTGEPDYDSDDEIPEFDDMKDPYEDL